MKSKGLKKLLWFLSTGRNALIVIICSTVAFYYHVTNDGNVPFRLSGTFGTGTVRVLHTHIVMLLCDEMTVGSFSRHCPFRVAEVFLPSHIDSRWEPNLHFYGNVPEARNWDHFRAVSGGFGERGDC